MPASTRVQGVLQASFFGGPTPPMSGPLFMVGNLWFVDPVNGADGNVGSQPGQPLKTLAQALKLAVPNNDDIIFFSGTVTLTAKLLWNVNSTHLVGLGAPGEIGNQNVISYAGSATLTPLVQVTGAGCYFANFQVSHAGTVAATAQVCWQDSGQQNVYDHVQFLGMGNAAGSAAQAGSRHLLIDGGNGQTTPTTGLGQMLFTRCVFGGTGVQRSAANASLEIQNASPRNIFRGCTFLANTSAATALHMTLGASSIDGTLLFDDCAFVNNTKAASAVAMTQAFSINATQTALGLFKASYSAGATKLETTPSNIMFVTESAASAAAGPYAINNT